MFVFRQDPQLRIAVEESFVVWQEEQKRIQEENRLKREQEKAEQRRREQVLCRFPENSDIPHIFHRKKLRIGSEKKT